MPNHRFLIPIAGIVLLLSGRCYCEGTGELRALLYVNSDGTELRPQFPTPVSFTFEFPATSPDGKWIAYSAVGKDGGGHIWIAEISGDNARTIAVAKGTRSNHPKWSPDSTHLSFTSNRDGHYDIFVVRADGSGLRNLTNDSERDFYPNWFPDGTRIIFLSTRGDIRSLYAINVDGTGLTRIPTAQDDDPELAHPAVSPDGSRIAYVATGVNDRRDVFVARTDGSNSKNITETTLAESGPVWSPSGNMLAFARGAGNIVTSSPSGAPATELNVGPGSNLHPSWTPGGRGIIFLTRREESDLKLLGLGPFETIVLLLNGGVTMSKLVGDIPRVGIEVVDSSGNIEIQPLTKGEAEIEFRRRGLPMNALNRLFPESN